MLYTKGANASRCKVLLNCSCCELRLFFLARSPQKNKARGRYLFLLGLSSLFSTHSCIPIQVLRPQAPPPPLRPPAQSHAYQILFIFFTSMIRCLCSWWADDKIKRGSCLFNPGALFILFIVRLCVGFFYFALLSSLGGSAAEF